MFSQVSLSLKPFQLQHCSICRFPVCAVPQINTKYVVSPLKTCSDAMSEFGFLLLFETKHCLSVSVLKAVFREHFPKQNKTNRPLVHLYPNPEAVYLRCVKQTWRICCGQCVFRTWLQNRLHDCKKATLNPWWWVRVILMTQDKNHLDHSPSYLQVWPTTERLVFL